MFEHLQLPKKKKEVYDLLLTTLENLIADTNDEIAILANSAALIKYFLRQVSWVGFYIYKNNELILGPFQGPPACVNIAIGDGVCGTSFQSGETIVVPDVNAYPNHIACDASTQSEIVIPIYVDNSLYGVLDLDSYTKARFTRTDKIYLEQVAEIIGSKLS